MNIPTPEQIAQFQEIAKDAWPQEAVALIVDGELMPCENIHKKPETHFRISPTVITALKREKKKISWMLHSHCVRHDRALPWPAQWPTGMDIDGYKNNKVPFGIVATDGEGCSEWVWRDDNSRPDLVGRPYVNGITDCYSAIRDWFKQVKGIDIPDFARDMDWWLKRDEPGYKNLYLENMEKAGFVEIPVSEATVGDCYLLGLRRGHLTHAAVITGPNEMFHHIQGKNGDGLSCHEEINRWVAFVEKAVRYVGTKK